MGIWISYAVHSKRILIFFVGFLAAEGAADTAFQ